MITEQIKTYIGQESLFNKEDKIVVGLSGGADSVALLLVLQELQYSVIAAHCNFHLRGEESQRDQLFVEELCKKNNIPLEIIHFDTFQYAEKNKVSIEMAARELRYNWFEEIRVKNKCHYIAVGHHRDDNIETLLLNLIRGTGIKGLTAIEPKNGVIRRPLLHVSRKEIIAYLSRNKQSYVTDSTNLEDEYARNKIRLNIIPEMELINSACQNNIHNTIQYLREANAIYTNAISKSKERVVSNNTISIPALLKEVAPSTVLYEILQPYGFNSKQVKQLFETIGQTEQREFISDSYRAVKSRDQIILSNSQEEQTEQAPTLSYEKVKIDSQFKIKRDRNIAYFDADKLDTDLITCRKWISGDYFIPFGMKGRKKVSDYFTDNKYSYSDKQAQWLLMHKDDIIWIIGNRTDNRYRITDKSTYALVVTLKQP